LSGPVLTKDSGFELLKLAEDFAANLAGHMPAMEKLGLLDGIAELGQYQPPVGLARGLRLPGNRWEHDESGQQMLVVPVCETIEVYPFDNFPVDVLNCFDLIAFKSSHPDVWYQLTGAAWALREDLFLPCENIRLVANPMEWLRGGGTAACILDWSENSQAWSRLRACAQLIFDDANLLFRVATMLQRTARLPVMEVRNAS
jgi:hypothetical protein